MTKSPRVLLIVPAYNEQQNILSTCQAIIQYNQSHPRSSYDFIIINDGSTDCTEQVIHAHHFPHIQLIQNLGIGGAVQTGYKYALAHHYDIAVQVDGDGQHDISSVNALIQPLISNQADMVIGSRFINQQRNNFRSSTLRRIGIKSISNIIHLKTGRRIYDTTSGFRAVNQSLIQLFAKDYSVEYPEPISIVAALLAGYHIAEVPAKMNKRESGKSSISKFKSIYYMINVILCIITLRRPREQ